MKPENRNQLVRGVAIFSQWHCGCSSFENALDDDNTGCTALFTPWHRGDDLGNIENELKQLVNLAMSFSDVDSVMSFYQYRDYK